jgi:hypothetical protein
MALGLGPGLAAAAGAPGLLPHAETAVAGKKLPRYELHLSIRTIPPGFHGSLRFEGFSAAASDRVYFELLPNTPRFTRGRAAPIQIRRVSQDGAALAFEERAGLLSIRLPARLAVGQAYGVQIEFSGALPLQPPGKTDLLAQSLEQLLGHLAGQEPAADYGTFSHGERIFNLGRFYPAALGAPPSESGAGPGDPRTLELADFALELTAPESLAVASSGVAVRTRSAGPGHLVHSIRAPASRDLALQLSSRYAVAVAAVGPVLVRSFFDRDHAERGWLALDTAAGALRVFTEEFGPYPYTELDVVEAPLYGGAGGMEYPGLVTVANLFYRADPMPASQGAFAAAVEDLQPLLREIFEFTVAHEVAHQWWSAAVGSDALAWPYLDESLANFSALLYVERRHGREAARRQEFLQMRFNYLVHRMAGGADAPADRPASRYESSLQYAAIVYGKAALFFPELRRLLGEEAFFSALRSYWREHFLGLAGPADLLRAFRGVAPDPAAVETLHRRWIEEAHGDEDLGRLGLLRLGLAALELRLRAARGEPLPQDPVARLMLLVELASQER